MSLEKKRVYQLNPLIEAQKDFNVMESRIFYLGLQDVNPHFTERDKYYDKEFPDTVITPSELKKIFGHGQYIEEVSKSAHSLIGRYISIYYENNIELYAVFQHIKYKENEGLFIKFNEDMRPFLLDIYKSYEKYGFTRLDMKQIFYLKSVYAMRLIELLLKYKSTATNGIIERSLTMEELRIKLNVPANAYEGRICNFRAKVLDAPIKDINSHTDYVVSYEVKKTGRHVTGFKFFCNCNKARKDEDFTSTVDSQPDQSVKETPALPEGKNSNEKTYIKFIHYGFSQKTVQALLEACNDDISELASRLEYGEQRAKQEMERGKKIENISGYLRRAIEENWLQRQKDEENEQERELAKANEKWVKWAKEQSANEPAPEVPEEPFKENEMGKIIISMIKEEVRNMKLSFTCRRLLAENGMTVARFVELYM